MFNTKLHNIIILWSVFKMVFGVNRKKKKNGIFLRRDNISQYSSGTNTERAHSKPSEEKKNDSLPKKRFIIFFGI